MVIEPINDVLAANVSTPSESVYVQGLIDLPLMTLFNKDLLVAHNFVIAT